MWKETVCLVAITLLLVQVKASPDISLEDLLERLVTLEDWKRETEYELSSLRETVTHQGAIIRNLERELSIQTNLTASLQSCNQDVEPQNTHVQELEAETEDDTVKEGQISQNRIRTADLDSPIPVKTSTLSKREIAGGVAFTAYLDHNVDLGAKQTIKFNQIITNDGNGYNNHSGLFTCPEAGVYLFSFFIGERSESGLARQIAVELVVNSQQIVSAIVDTIHDKQDLQGGNTAVVRLNPGDTVWVEVLFPGEHVQGSTALRLTTFTGVYLYG